MKIISLEASNFMRVSAVRIEPNGTLNVVGGDNAQGKTSVLDSIMCALAGGRSLPAKPVHDGADKAIITIDLDEIIVTRTIKDDGKSTVKVSTKEGTNYPSPQSVLDALIGKISFDPLAFSRMDNKSQLETLKSMVGLDFSKLDERRKELYEERTVVNRYLKSAHVFFESMPGDVDGEMESSGSVMELMAELEKRKKHNSEKLDLDNCAQEYKKSIISVDDDIKEISQKIEEMKAQLEGLYKKKQSLADQYKKSLKEADEFVRLDEQEIIDKINNLETVNNTIRDNKAKVVAYNEINQIRQRYDGLTKEIESIDSEKASALSSVKFPIEGLSFDESGVTYNGIPFSQSSGAEKLRVSCAIGIAMNPKLRVLLIRDGSLLDEQNMKIIAQMAEENDAQVWLERVGHGEECTVVIEDGMVKS